MQRVGDWEGGTVVGQGTARLVTLVERKSGFLRVRRVATGEADPTMRAVIHALHPLAARVHTITWDNGSEFAEHALIDIALGAKSYFAAPTHPGNAVATKISMASYGSTSPRAVI